MSKIEVNTVAPQCGTTLTLGESGDTVTLGAGASQSGFGRTGTVDWQTGSIKTATFTAANGEGYFANTSGGAFTMNLPAGTAGNIVSVVDYTNTFQTNSLTISPNGSQKIGGVAANFFATVEGQSLTFVYVDDIEGWKNVQDSTSNATGDDNLIATGGTITTSGDFKIHTFTGPGTFTVAQVSATPANNEVSYMVVAGGGAGGRLIAGGGGGGGFRERKSAVDTYTASPLNGSTPITITATAYPITVGAGGAAISGPLSPEYTVNPGSNSVFSTITSAGGGGGLPGSGPVPGLPAAGTGGSGGGGRRCGVSGRAGNTPPVSPPQGNPGGNGSSGPAPDSQGAGAGGGGAGGAGSNASGGSNTAGSGGAGVTSEINPAAGSPATNFSGGGGGSVYNPGTAGAGGTGGGGNGGPGAAPAIAGVVNTGGGGGASGYPTAYLCGVSGGSGIVVIRYKFQ